MNNIENKCDTRATKGIHDSLKILEHSVAAWVILIISLMLTFVAWMTTEKIYEKRMQDRFSYRVSRIAESIEDRLLQYEQVLRGGIGLFDASDSVSREEWKTYVGNCELAKYFPGIQGMGFAIAVTADEKLAHEKNLRSQGFEDYQIHPNHQRDFYTSIIYLEPFDWRNQRAFGYDMYSNETRREAMNRAIETGDPAMSGMVTLQQETKNDIQKGWLYYLPVFEKSKVDEHIEQDGSSNREKLKGFVYAAFRANDLMAGILDPQDTDVKFEIFDSLHPTPNRLLFDSDDRCHLESDEQAKYSGELCLNIRGRTWSLHFESRPNFIESTIINQSSLIAFGGLIVDFLLFLVIGVIGRQKSRAMQIASDMTRDVRAREELINGILLNASEAIITIDEQGRVEIANRVAKAMFGFLDSATHNKILFDDFLTGQTWSSLVTKFNLTSDGQYTCRVDAKRGENDTFACCLNMGAFATGDRKYYILIAQDESNRIASDRKMAEITNELIKASRTAAKVEFANGVLHNVGNAVNSINVSTRVLQKSLKQSSTSKLTRLCQLIADHEQGFTEFVNEDPRGNKIPMYLKKVAGALTEENLLLARELDDLNTLVTHIKEVIKSQQSDAKSCAVMHSMLAKELLEDSIVANKATLIKNDIEIEVEVEEGLPEVHSDKHRIIQILVNLIKNANDALVENQSSNPRIVARVRKETDKIIFEVEDNGIGVSAENLKKIFSHGFSTKASGHGFGLHSSVKAASDLGCTLSVSSQGVGMGATFKLAIPITPNQSVATGNGTTIPIQFPGEVQGVIV